MIHNSPCWLTIHWDGTGLGVKKSVLRMKKIGGIEKKNPLYTNYAVIEITTQAVHSGDVGLIE